MHIQAYEVKNLKGSVFPGLALYDHLIVLGLISSTLHTSDNRTSTKRNFLTERKKLLTFILFLNGKITGKLKINFKSGFIENLSTKSLIEIN